MATLGASGSIWLHVFEGMCTDHADYVWILEERQLIQQMSEGRF